MIKIILNKRMKIRVFKKKNNVFVKVDMESQKNIK